MTATLAAPAATLPAAPFFVIETGPWEEDPYTDRILGVPSEVYDEEWVWPEELEAYQETLEQQGIPYVLVIFRGEDRPYTREDAIADGCI